MSTKVKNMAQQRSGGCLRWLHPRYLVFNVRDASFDKEAGPAALQDVNVRKAVRLAIDRRAINHDLLADAATVTDSLYAGTQWENKDLRFRGSRSCCRWQAA